MPGYMCAAFIVLAILAVDYVLASRDAVRQGKTSWTFWSKDSAGTIADIVIGLIFGGVTVVVVSLIRFSDRIFLDPFWESVRRSRGVWAFVGCTSGVVGGVVFGRLRTFWRTLEYMKPLSPRWIIQIVTCVVAAIMLHRCLTEWGSGLCVDAEPPLSAWFGVVAGEMRLMPAQMPGSSVRYGAPMYWIGPQMLVTKYRDLVCFVGGMLAPPILLCAAVFSFVRGSRDTRGTGGEPGQNSTQPEIGDRHLDD
jgi:uncharacterized membrane protein YeaQ/YmgE (transglycosylase-associated protein family)